MQAIPAAWLVDKQGRAHAGGQEDDLDAEIAKLIADKPLADAAGTK